MTTKAVLFMVALGASACATGNRNSDGDGRVEKMPRPPVCISRATQPEGWLLENGEHIRESCLGKVVYCDRVGTTFEGWYAAEVGSEQLINRENCSKVQNHKPVCTAVDSYAEGWTTSKDRRVFWDSCRHKVVVCARIGTESEGWYAQMPRVETAKPIQKVKCGELLIRSSYYR